MEFVEIYWMRPRQSERNQIANFKAALWSPLIFIKIFDKIYIENKKRRKTMVTPDIN